MNFLDVDFPGITEAFKGSLEDWLELFERYAFPRTGDTETSAEMKRIFKRYPEVTYEDWLDIIIKSVRDELWYEEKINLSIRELYLVVRKYPRIEEKLKTIYNLLIKANSSSIFESSFILNEDGAQVDGLKCRFFNWLNWLDQATKDEIEDRFAQAGMQCNIPAVVSPISFLQGNDTEFYLKLLSTRDSGNKFIERINTIENKPESRVVVNLDFFKKTLQDIYDNLPKDVKLLANQIGQFLPEDQTNSFQHSGIYALCSRETKQIYIGKALRLDGIAARLDEHNKRANGNDSSFHIIRKAITGTDNLDGFDCFVIYSLHEPKELITNLSETTELISTLEKAFAQPFFSNFFDLNTREGGQVSDIKITAKSLGGEQLRIKILKYFLDPNKPVVKNLGLITQEAIGKDLNIHHSKVAVYNNIFKTNNTTLIKLFEKVIELPELDAARENFLLAKTSQCSFTDAIKLKYNLIPEVDNRSNIRKSLTLYVGLPLGLGSEEENLVTTFLTATKEELIQNDNFILARPLGKLDDEKYARGESATLIKPSKLLNADQQNEILGDFFIKQGLLLSDDECECLAADDARFYLALPGTKARSNLQYFMFCTDSDEPLRAALCKEAKDNIPRITIPGDNENKPIRIRGSKPVMCGSCGIAFRKLNFY